MPGTLLYSLTQDARIDGLFMQDLEARLAGLPPVVAWDLSQSRTITYSFPNAGADYMDAELFLPWYWAQLVFQQALNGGMHTFTSAQQNAVHRIVSQVEAVTRLDLAPVIGENDGDATIRFAQSSFVEDAGPAGLGIPPGLLSTSIAGDVWIAFLDGRFQNPVPGNQAYWLIMHETLHALGLKHAHEQGLLGEGLDTDIFGFLLSSQGDNWGTAVPIAWDSPEFTVMTYRNFVGGPTEDKPYRLRDNPETPMMLDIAALQHLYGADFTTNNSNTDYRWNPATGERYVNGTSQGGIHPRNIIFETIWDGGGIDTYWFDNYTTNLAINLEPGGWSRVSSGDNLQRALLAEFVNGQPNEYARGNVFNALLYRGDPRSLIENAIGGSGNDSIVGNQAANRLVGNGGIDYLAGRGGNDTLEGGAGDDTLEGGIGNDTLDGGAGTGDVASYANAAAPVTIDLAITTRQNTIGDGSDLLTRIENITGSIYSDRLFGNNGDNTIRGDGDSDLAGGNDTIEGRGGNDTLYGFAGDDTLRGGDGNDKLYGQADNDTLVGGQGRDEIYGDAGNDTLKFSASSVFAQGSFVSISSSDAVAGEIIDGGSGTDKIVVNSRVNFSASSITSIEQLAFEAAIASQNKATFVASQITAGRLSTTLAVAGSTRADQVEINLGTATAVLLHGFTFTNWNSGDQVIINGSASGDIIGGSVQADTINGNGGADRIVGGPGADRLFGGAGNDQFEYNDGGGAVGETINGGNDTDSLVVMGHVSFVPTQTQTVLGPGGTPLTLLTYLPISIQSVEKLEFGNNFVNTTNTADFAATQFVAGGLSTSLAVVGTTLTDRITISMRDSTSLDLRSMTFSGWSADDALIVTGDNDSETITGSRIADTINGGGGGDRIAGGLGNDRLTGGSGLDQFVFNTALGPANVDTIVDFSVIDDTILLENAVMTGLGRGTGTLANGLFVIGSAAADKEDRIIFDSVSGNLYYDADGNAPDAAPVQFASIPKNLALTNLDFLVI